jgi:hypothetical protein
MKMFEPKKRCLMCDAKCDKIHTTIKYSYEADQVGEAYLCEKCTEEYNLKDKDLENEQSF